MSLRTGAWDPANGHPLRGEEPKGALLPRWPSAGGEHGGLWGDEVWQSASPQKCLASWHHFGQIRSHFCIRPKYCFSFCPTARRSGLPRRFAPRNDMLKTGRCARVQGRNDMQKVGRCARVQGRNDMQKLAGCLRVQRRNAVQNLAGYLHLPGGTAGAVPPRDLSPCRLGHPG